MAFLNAFGQEFLQRWKNVSFGQKLVVGMLAFSSIVVIVVLALWASKADLGLLYSGLDPKDAAEVVNELDAAKVPYELRDGGTTVMASVDNVYALRLRMASKGLPRGTAGFEIFEKPNLGVTDFVQQVNYVRALQGELARTIGSLQQVEWARVMIARPEKSLFIEDAKEPTASVVIKTRSGRPLSENQLAGVTHLVAGSVEGLEPGNVVITDDRGNLLSKGAQSSLTATMSSHLDAQRQLEDYLASKAQAMLERVLGPGRSIVKVSADLDMRKTSETKVEYGKDANKLPRRMSSRTTTTSRAPSGGVAGTAANVPPAATATGGTGTVSSDTEETTEYYEPLSHTEVATVNEPGQTKRLSVAAFINGGSYKVTKSPDGTESRQYQPMDDAQKGTFEKIIMQAVGYDAGRGDEVVVHDVEFNMPESTAPEPAQPGGSSFTSLVPVLVKYGSIVLAAGIFAVFGLLVLKRTGAATVQTTEASAEPGPQPSAASGRQAATAPTDHSRVAEDVDQFARQNVADTTRVLRQWLQENAPEKVAAAD